MMLFTNANIYASLGLTAYVIHDDEIYLTFPNPKQLALHP